MKLSEMASYSSEVIQSYKSYHTKDIQNVLAGKKKSKYQKVTPNLSQERYFDEAV